MSREKFGVTSPDLDELVTWADRIDAARFESAAQAVDRSDPVMRLVSVVEHYGDDGFLERFVPELLSRPLAEVARSPEIAARYRPLGRLVAAGLSIYEPNPMQALAETERTKVQTAK